MIDRCSKRVIKLSCAVLRVIDLYRVNKYEKLNLEYLAEMILISASTFNSFLSLFYPWLEIKVRIAGIVSMRSIVRSVPVKSWLSLDCNKLFI